MKRAWDVQVASNWWLSLGFHVDHTDPSVTLHLPGLIVYAGRCKQPGFGSSIFDRPAVTRRRRAAPPIGRTYDAGAGQ